MSADKSRLASAMKPRRERATPVAETFLPAEEPASRAREEVGGTSQTSVRLPTELHKRARYYSIDSGVSLNTLVVEGLELRLAQDR